MPAGALVVDGTRGADTNPGTTAYPKKSINAAVNAATNGQTVVVRAGTYHESVTIPAGRSITVQNYPGEAVWLDGSRTVTGWTRSGTTWVLDGWTPEFDASASFTTGQSYSGGMLRPEYPAAAKPDQLFIDGVAQQQVMSAAQVTPGTFAVDYANDRLIMGTDPTGRDVRATDLPFAIDVLGTKNTVQGIGVRRYATSMPRIGTVRVWGGYNTIRDLHVQDVATVGISFIRPGNTADHVTVNRAGLLGIHANQADDITITNSVVSDNNTERFKEAPTAAGIKITRTRGITIDNVLAKNNLSMGIWMDESCYDITVVNSEAANNTNTGIELELSDTGIVANNRVTGNLNGILLFNTGNIQVFNNEIGANRMMGLKLWQDARRQATHPVGRDPRAPVPDLTVPWVTRNITVANNVFGAGGMFQVYALDKETNRAVDTWNLTITGNLFNPRPTTSQPTVVAWGGDDNVKLYRYETPAALATAKNPSWRNAQATTYLPLTDLLALARTHTAIATPLPTDVATATGTTTGTQTVGTLTR